MEDPFADIRDKRMSEMTDEQKDRCHELWLRQNMQFFNHHYWSDDRALFPSIFRVIDRLREANQK